MLTNGAHSFFFFFLPPLRLLLPILSGIFLLLLPGGKGQQGRALFILSVVLRAARSRKVIRL